MNSATDTQKPKAGLLGTIRSIIAFVKYNAVNVFAGKFIYFMLLGLALFLMTVVIYVLNEEAPPSAEAVYYFLLVPGVLLVFYPSVYSIQTDVDSRMIETLFGIPDYRYKVWLVRNLTQYLVIAGLLTALGLLSQLALADFNIVPMIFHLMFPIVFLSCTAFMTATLTRNGNGTAVVMVLVILFFWIAAEPLDGSRWNLFHNPFELADQLDTFLIEETTLYNRIYLLVGSALAMLFGLLRLQKREKFV